MGKLEKDLLEYPYTLNELSSGIINNVLLLKTNTRNIVDQAPFIWYAYDTTIFIVPITKNPTMVSGESQIMTKSLHGMIRKIIPISGPYVESVNGVHALMEDGRIFQVRYNNKLARVDVEIILDKTGNGEANGGGGGNDKVLNIWPCAGQLDKFLLSTHDGVYVFSITDRQCERH